MQNDIVPPTRRPNTKTVDRQLMKSLRLQGHSSDNAQKRLSRAEEQESIEIDGTRVEERKPHKRSLKQFWHGLSKRQKVAASASGLAVLLLVGFGVFSLFKSDPSVPVAKNEVEAMPPPPTTVASPLTGIQVDQKLAKRPVTGVMIENSLDARPQSGLQEAGVVYEAVAEAGITRFMALFQENQPQYVGPVRSLRPYYLDFAAPHEASIAHVGGSPEALAQVRNGQYRDIDQFFNAGTYWRVASRYAPHNVYTSFKNLDSLNKQKKYNSSDFTPWTRKDDEPATKPTAKSIDLRISSDLYNARFDYDKKSNTYFRSEGGKPHYNIPSEKSSTGIRLKPKVVVVMVMNYSVIDAAGHSSYTVKGKGSMYLFQDGKIQKGVWKKADRKSMFKFEDKEGKQLSLNAGQVWATVIKSPTEVSYKP